MKIADNLFIGNFMSKFYRVICLLFCYLFQSLLCQVVTRIAELGCTI